ncbi:UNVERIFIED_CONTAM: hypothetical protein K2H54_039729 [Gekko kuhli]
MRPAKKSIRPAGCFCGRRYSGLGWSPSEHAAAELQSEQPWSEQPQGWAQGQAPPPAGNTRSCEELGQEEAEKGRGQQIEIFNNQIFSSSSAKANHSGCVYEKEFPVSRGPVMGCSGKIS